MEQLKKEIEVFVAKDGKEFLIKSECENYEKNVLEIKSNIKYFRSCCCPDLTEGRGWYRNIYFAVLEKNYCHFERALKYMIDKYKSPIEYVQGVAPMPNWSVPKECTEQEFIDMSKPKVGDYYHYSEQVFISEEKVEGMPEPIWVS